MLFSFSKYVSDRLLSLGIGKSSGLLLFSTSKCSEDGTRGGSGLVGLGRSIFELFWLFDCINQGSIGGGVLNKSGCTGVWYFDSFSDISSYFSSSDKLSSSSYRLFLSLSDGCFSFCFS